MSGLEQLYQQIIMDHAKHPHGTDLAAGEKTSHQRNPVCGDEVTLALRWDAAGDRIADVAWEGSGCSISQASASLLATLAEESAAEGAAWTPEELTALIAEFREALRSRGAIALDEERFGDAAALSGVSKYVARVKCAMLAWVAAEDLLVRRAGEGR
ncbi:MULTISPECIES: Fe-S cluster assembly sulfur transfer protein SufU [unclassified Microcella]|uniref:Fe-S cluster assembly sulfur transfer protein SufU n=1 Tax=unclassified Microcella TaxID=2630066 RepID=UPI0006F3AB2A|nr:MULTISPECIES: SUF system NifU family Fe-S cluster assembly protein [unclassified Microcella]KQV26288.1 nitrogen fixation protein NifU [Yonghaparkia sp. Root332]KRF32928.1 nitrogen fixation protein NifU [Yonghaparkia sp. Soil809]